MKLNFSALTGRKKPPLPLFEELAPAQNISLLGALHTVAFPGDGLPGGEGSYATYRKMLKDPQVKACLSTKKFAALSQGWSVHAASESSADLAVAGFVRAALTNMRGSVLDALLDLLDALALGVSLLEINYRLIEGGPYAGMVGLESLKSKDPGLFLFETDSFANVTGLRGVLGGVYPPDKFLRYSYQPEYENPLGRSDLAGAYKAWFVKQQLLRWWAKYLETFGGFTAL
jgi:hypothetical protein